MLAALLLVSGAINASHLPEPEPRSCNIEVEGESYQSLMLTNTNEEYQISLHGYCHLRILLVGGGGQGNRMNSGGGSGYLKYYEVTLLESSVVAKVGNHGEPSTVTVNGATIIAESGGEGEHIKGGDGFCGGVIGTIGKATMEVLLVEMVREGLEVLALEKIFHHMFSILGACHLGNGEIIIGIRMLETATTLVVVGVGFLLMKRAPFQVFSKDKDMEEGLMVILNLVMVYQESSS